MYIKSLSLSGIKLFRDLNLSFEVDGKPRMWTVLIGENGLGKTTILRSIAMAASGSARTNQLADIPSYRSKATPRLHSSYIRSKFVLGELGHFRREYPRTISTPPEPPLLQSGLGLAPGSSIMSGVSDYSENESNKNSLVAFPYISNKSSFDEIDHTLIEKWYMDDPLAQIRAKNAPDWFVVGYGVDRRLPSVGFTPKLNDPAFQRMASLFDRGPIIATGFVDLFETEALKVEYFKSLYQALNNTKILPKISGMELRGRNGSTNGNGLIDGDRFSFGIGKSPVNIPAPWLSQGYQSTIAWIADLIGQMFWDAKRPVDIAEMEGLVLIDEIDIHLHPTWQVHLIEALKTTFPRLQFVVTTHSPMVLPGLKKEEILRIRQTEEGAVVVEPVNESPAVMTGSELYEAFFGIEGLFSREVGDQLNRYGYLSSDPYRTDEEDQEMKRIEQALQQADVLPKWEPVPRETL